MSGALGGPTTSEVDGTEDVVDRGVELVQVVDDGQVFEGGALLELQLFALEFAAVLRGAPGPVRSRRARASEDAAARLREQVAVVRGARRILPNQSLDQR